MSPVSGSPVNGGDGAKGTEGLSRDELYEMAKRADVPDRSSMTKDELAAAVAERE